MIEHTIATELHVVPPSMQIASGDRRARRFDAGTAIDTATVRLERLGTDPPVEMPDLVEPSTPDADGIDLVIIGGDRGRTYLLTVTFTAGLDVWSRLLTVRVVA